MPNDNEAFLQQAFGAPQGANANFVQQNFGSQAAADVPQLAVHHTHGLWDSFKAGLESSTSGLVLRQEAPDISVGPDADRSERIASMVGQTIGDLPTLIGGGFAGGAVAGPVGAGAGAMALTEGTRSWLMQQYQQGFTKTDLADRITATAWAAAKAGVVGAATAGVGGKIAGAAFTEGMAPINQMLTQSTAELGTMVTVSKALEGKLPSLNDFVDGAIMLGGFKAAHMVSSKLQMIYERTGMTPQEVTEQAIKDPALQMDLIDPRGYDTIPEQLKGAETSPLAPADPRLQKIADEPTMKIPEQLAGTEHPNYDATFRDMGEMNEGLARIVNEYKPEIDAARKAGGVTWEQTREDAAKLAEQWLGKDGMKVDAGPNSVDWAVQMRARSGVVQSLMKDYWEKLQVLKTDKTNIEAQASVFAAIDRLQMAYQSFRGASAEVGRAMNVLKDSAFLPEAERLSSLKEIIDQNGGASAIDQLLSFTEKSGDMAAAARILGKPITTMDKILELWKSGLVSGPTTQIANVLSNTTFALLRLPKQMLADTISTLKGDEGASFVNSVSLLRGLTAGVFDASKHAYVTIADNVSDKGFLSGVAKTFLEMGSEGKQEGGPRPALQGNFGEIVRTPFKLLSAADGFFRTMNTRAELYSRASEQAISEGLKPMSDEYNTRMAEIVNNPSAEMQKLADDAGTRYVFQERTEGSFADSIQKLTHEHPSLQFILPFIRTPANIFKEFARMSPFAPLVKQWRADFSSADPMTSARASAEALMGTGLALGAFVLANDNVVSGAGHPDKDVRSAWRAAGWQPYSIRMSNGQWVSYNRMEPAGTLLGLAADVSTAWRLMETPERDKVWSVLSFGFVNAVTNKTMLQGLASVLGAVSHPAQDAPKWMEQLSASVVPGIVGQTAQELDPYVREVNSILDAVKSRIPGLREQVPLKRDIYGEPVKNANEPFPFSPIKTSQESTDKVRSEGMRLNIGQPGAPQGIQINFPGRPGDRKIEFTPQQKDIFSSTAGNAAHDILSDIVNRPGWEEMPTMMQRQYYIRAFAAARHQGSIEALPAEQRVGALDSLRQEYGL